MELINVRNCLQIFPHVSSPGVSNHVFTKLSTLDITWGGMFAVLVCPLTSVKRCSPHTFSSIDQVANCEALFNSVSLANTHRCGRLSYLLDWAGSYQE